MQANLPLIIISLSEEEEPDILWKGIKFVDGSAPHRSVYYGDVFMLLK